MTTVTENPSKLSKRLPERTYDRPFFFGMTALLAASERLGLRPPAIWQVSVERRCRRGLYIFMEQYSADPTRISKPEAIGDFGWWPLVQAGEVHA